MYDNADLAKTEQWGVLKVITKLQLQLLYEV